MSAGSSFGPYNIYYNQIGEGYFARRGYENYEIRNFPFGPGYYLNTNPQLITFPYSAHTLIVYNVACDSVVATYNVIPTTPTQTPVTPTPTQTVTQTNTQTPTQTQTNTQTPTQTQTNTQTPTQTPSETPTNTPTVTPTPTRSRFAFAGTTGSTSNDACTGSASVVFYGEESQFDQNIQLFNNIIGPVTINMTSYFAYNSIVVQLDSGGITVGPYTLCPP